VTDAAATCRRDGCTPTCDLDTSPEIGHRARHELRALGVGLLDDPSSSVGSASTS
jgi:hypothetical protein